VTRRSRVRLAEICGRLRPAGAHQRPPLRFAAGPRLRRDHLRAVALRFYTRKRRWFWRRGVERAAVPKAAVDEDGEAMRSGVPEAALVSTEMPVIQLAPVSLR
jgi:hypothetical protein